MGELKRIKKYNNINIYFKHSFETFIGDIARAIRDGYSVYLFDKLTKYSLDINTTSVQHMVEVLKNINNEIAERKGINLDCNTNHNRYLCYYITEEDADSASQTVEQEAEA